jgi:hypothetical protein
MALTKNEMARSLQNQLEDNQQHPCGSNYQRRIIGSGTIIDFRFQ